MRIAGETRGEDLVTEHQLLKLDRPQYVGGQAEEPDDRPAPPAAYARVAITRIALTISNS